MKRTGIAVGGNSVVDYVKIVDNYPEQGKLSNIRDVHKCIGGAVPNVLIDLAKMDTSLKLQAIGFTGNDKDGEYIIAKLKDHDIDTKLMKQHKHLGTSFTDVISVKSTGERTFFHYRGANMDLGYEQFEFPEINACILHIGYALLLDSMDSFDDEYGTVMARTLAEAQKKGIKTSMDVVSEDSSRFSKIVPPSLKYTDYCIINEVEASMITGIQARMGNGKLNLENMEKMCHKIYNMGVGQWVVIHSPEMGCGIDSSMKLHVSPSVDVPEGYIKGKVGAGDAFCAGILYAAYKGVNLKQALEIGNGAAICNLSQPGATEGMRSITAIRDIVKMYPRTKK